MTELTFVKVLMLIRQVFKRAHYLSLLVFLDKGFKFQPDVCNGCLDVLTMSMNVDDMLF